MDYFYCVYPKPFLLVAKMVLSSPLSPLHLLLISIDDISLGFLKTTSSSVGQYVCVNMWISSLVLHLEFHWFLILN